MSIRRTRTLSVTLKCHCVQYFSEIKISWMLELLVLSMSTGRYQNSQIWNKRGLSSVLLLLLSSVSAAFLFFFSSSRRAFVYVSVSLFFHRKQKK